MHSASIPGILALDVHSTDTSKVLTGGNDKNATVFNKDTEQMVAILKGHTKKVTKVIYHSNEDIVLTGKCLFSKLSKVVRWFILLLYYNVSRLHFIKKLILKIRLL